MPKTAIFETNVGTITAELYETDAPLAVANFEKLANEKFYDGVKFHRVIADFVVQGGDPLSKDLPDGDPRVGTGGPGYKIDCETAGSPPRADERDLETGHPSSLRERGSHGNLPEGGGLKVLTSRR